MLAVDPAGPQDEVTVELLGDGALAGQLARAVNAQRCGGVVLLVRPARLTVEHVVGGKMEQWRAETFGHLGQHGCTVPVDCIGESGVLFGGVDLGIGAALMTSAGRSCSSVRLTRQASVRSS